MPTANSGPSDRRRRRPRRRWIALVLILGALVALGLFLLFSGTAAGCEEITGTDGGPAIRCGFGVARPPAAVWEAFTGTGEPRPYFFRALLQAELEVGCRWRFLTHDGRRLLAGGEILELDPPRRFVHTFAAADLDDPPSRIAVEVEPASGGSRVTLLHDRFSSRTATYRRFRRAHPLSLSALQAFLETGEVPFPARLYTAIFSPGMKYFTVRAEPWEEGCRVPGP